MDQQFVFEGRVSIHDDGDSSDVLFLSDVNLLEAFAEALDERRRQVSVRYFVSDEPLTEEQRTHAQVMVAVGEGYAEFCARYSEATGYLWTDEDLTVGGHDLQAELRSYEGKWCRLELTVHEDEPTPTWEELNAR